MSSEIVKKDSKIGYIITIVILVLMLLGLCIYIGLDKYVFDANELDEDVFEVRELSYSEGIYYLDKIREYNTYLYKYFLTKEVDEITNEDALIFAQSRFPSSEITPEMISSALEEYFGKNHKYKLDDILCVADGEVIYKYDEENNKYIKTEHEWHTGPDITLNSVYYQNSIVDENKITVVTKNLYYGFCASGCDSEFNSVYSSIEDLKNKQNPVIKSEFNIYPVNPGDYYAVNVFEKLPNTTYNFVIDESGFFYLDNVVIE